LLGFAEMRKNLLLRGSYLCAAVAAGLVALHFNAELFPGWTRGMAVLSCAFALAGAGLAATSIGSAGWTHLKLWPAHVAVALNILLALGFFFYATPY
jgi:hypothetical protein